MEQRGRPWVILGAFLMGVSAVAPWLGDLLSSEWGFGVPLALAFDLETSATAPPIAVVLLAAAAVTLAATTVRWAWPIRQIAGALVVILTVAIGVQVVRFSMGIDAGFLSVLNPLGAGAYLALAGGLLALLAPVPERAPASHPVQAAPPATPAAAPPVQPAASAPVVPQAVPPPAQEAAAPAATGEMPIATTEGTPAGATAREPATEPVEEPVPEEPVLESPAPTSGAATPPETEGATDTGKPDRAVVAAEEPEPRDRDGEERPGDEPA